MSAPVTVLGATGGVGRHVCAAFRAAGDNVLGIARSASAAGSTLRLDLADAAPERLAETFAAHRTEIVVNATGGWIHSAEAMRLAHVQIVERLVAAGALLADPPRVVHIGTIHEYGPVPDGTLIDENRTPAPETDYARTKLAGSQALLDATAAGTARAVVLRAVNVCGPGTTSASFLGACLERIRGVRSGDRVPMTIANARRDYIDVRDLADAVVRAAHAPERTVGQVINVGRSEAVAMRQLVEWLLAAAGLPPDTIDEHDAAVQSKGGDWTRADIRRARRLLDWQPRTALDASLRDMWHAANRRTPKLDGTTSAPS
jgi:NDP-hexose 4-ketoreductase